MPDEQDKSEWVSLMVELHPRDEADMSLRANKQRKHNRRFETATPFFMGRTWPGEWWRLRRLDDYYPMMAATGAVGVVLLAITMPLFPVAQALNNVVLAVLAMWAIIGILALQMAWTLVLFARMFVTMFTRPS